MLLCPSMMCADGGRLADEVHELDAAGADIFHCDVMDGSFVPNFALGLEDVKAIRSATDKLVDVHLMVENPSNVIELFSNVGVDIIYIHPESERYTTKTLSRIRELGKKAGLAINPDTPLVSVMDMLEYCDYVMVMTVNPGFAGQQFVDFTARKVDELARHKEALGYQLVMDGSCTPERVRHYSLVGVDGFVLGTSALFGRGVSYAETLKQLHGQTIDYVRSDEGVSLTQL